MYPIQHEKCQDVGDNSYLMTVIMSLISRNSSSQNIDAFTFKFYVPNSTLACLYPKGFHAISIQIHDIAVAILVHIPIAPLVHNMCIAFVVFCFFLVKWSNSLKYTLPMIMHPYGQ